ncbi:MAG TPA: nucleoside triphosphate pyrophosphohydrolase [Patescibacteria group bacterium]|nr:nucleoside triphosphate pyrophosphohydrolase [Patescibacteria group bacterium]
MNKLVRDNIPDIIKKSGKTGIIHIADSEEYLQKIYEKLQEETKEFLKERKIEELADLLELIYTIAKIKNISKEKLEQIRLQKKEVKGGFDKKYILNRMKN